MSDESVHASNGSSEQENGILSFSCRSGCSEEWYLSENRVFYSDRLLPRQFSAYSFLLFVFEEFRLWERNELDDPCELFLPSCSAA